MEPEQLGKYVVRDVIGRGAVGAVYAAWDPVIERPVAIKKLLGLGTSSPEPDKHLRFKQEARAAGRLSHPNIVGTFDYGETADCAYIVMELLPGPSLKEAIARRSISRTDVAGIMSGILNGLHHSHERGVVHRDIKPANIVFAEDGEVKITDFGIARLENSDLTQTGSQLGTPAYMAPEQVLGDPADARSDLYSAAVVLFEMLTFRRPFEGGTSSVLHHIVWSPPPPASHFAELVSPEIDEVLKKGLSKRPDDRFQTATEFAEALQIAFAVWVPNAVGERLPPPAEEPAAEPRRRPSRAGARPLVLLASAVLASAAVATLVLDRPGATPGAPTSQAARSSNAADGPSSDAAAADTPARPDRLPAPVDPDASTAPRPEPTPPTERPDALAASSDGAARPGSDPPSPAPALPSGQAAVPAVAGRIDTYSAEGWPVIAGTAVRLAGVAALPASAQKLVTSWAAAHGGLLSCEPVGPEGSDAFQCLTAQSLDLSQTILLNGLAKAAPDAAEAYGDAEQQARGARRGLWR